MQEKSFEGIVKLYKEEFYVNTRTGVGLDSVLKKIDPLLNKMASKTYMRGHSFEDIKQEIVILAIDGVRSYDPKKQAMLSTFLHIHLKNKLISKLKKDNSLSKDAFGLKEKNSSDSLRKARSEVSIESLFTDNNKGSGESFASDVLSEEKYSLHGDPKNNFSKINFKVSLNSLLEKISPDVSDAIKLMYYEDCSIKDASKAVGMTEAVLRNRLKRLSKNRLFQDIFEEYIDN